MPLWCCWRLEEEGCILLKHEKANLSARAEPVLITFLDGVPVPEAGTQGDGMTAEDFDRAEIIRVMKAAHDAGISVPASTIPGAHSAMKALESLTEYGQTFRGKSGGQRVARAITALIRVGRIQRVEFKTAQRKIRERLELVELPHVAAEQVKNTPAPSAPSAPRHPPITPQRIGAAHWDACASAPTMKGAAPITICAIGAKENALDLIATPEPGKRPANLPSELQH